MYLASLRNALCVSSLFVVLSLCSCMVGCAPVPPKYRAFLEMPPQQQREQMESASVEKQIDYFLAGETYVHPPLRLGDYVAKRGMEAVPFLIERLEKEDSEARQVDILYVLEDINQYYYNLNDEKEAIEAMRAVVANMKDPLHKPRAKQAFESIEGQRVLIPRNQ